MRPAAPLPHRAAPSAKPSIEASAQRFLLGDVFRQRRLFTSARRFVEQRRSSLSSHGKSHFQPLISARS